MIYTCNNCRFTFSRVGEVESCPDCGKTYVIREATDKEKDDYKKYRDEYGIEKKRAKE